MEAERIFISYRREDSAYTVGSIHEKLRASFGRKNVFIDVDSIPIGMDFRKFIDAQVAGCSLMLVVIGKNWNKTTNKGGSPKIFDTTDFVRIEIESALNRRIPIIPILLDGSNLPKPNELPTSIKEIVFRQGIHIRPAPDFNYDINRLIDKIKDRRSSVQPKHPKTKRANKNGAKRIGLIIVMMALIVSSVIFFPQLDKILYSLNHLSGKQLRKDSLPEVGNNGQEVIDTVIVEKSEPLSDSKENVNSDSIDSSIIEKSQFNMEGLLVDKRDNQEYKWLRVDQNLWMVDNLNYFIEGESLCYRFSEFNCRDYGRLYTKKAAKVACPDGWRLPNEKEWEDFGNFLGEDSLKLIFPRRSGFASVWPPRDGEWTFSRIDVSSHYWTSNEINDNMTISVACLWNSVSDTTSYAWFEYDENKPIEVERFLGSDIAYSCRCIKSI